MITSVFTKQLGSYLKFEKSYVYHPVSVLSSSLLQIKSFHTKKQNLVLALKTKILYQFNPNSVP